MKLKQYTILIFISVLSAGDNRIPPPEFVGHWRGKGHEIVSWSEADSITFDLTIYNDGTVNGSVGDAKLENGIFKKNSWLAIKFGNPKYLIGGDLKGYIVADEKIYRRKIKWLIIDYIEGRLEGGFHTSGTFTHPWAGNEHWKAHMHMTGIDVILFPIDS